MMEPSWVTIGTAPVPTMLLPPTAMPLPVLSPIRLKSTAVMVPEPGSLKMSGPKPAVLPATMVLFSVRKPALRIPPPMPRGTLLPAIVEFRTIRVPLLKIPPPDMADSLSAMVEFVIVSVPPPLSFTMPPPLPEDTLLAIVELAISSVPRLKIAPAAPLPSAIVNPEIATMTPAPTSKGRKLLAPEIVSIAALGAGDGEVVGDGGEGRGECDCAADRKRDFVGDSSGAVGHGDRFAQSQPIRWVIAQGVDGDGGGVDRSTRHARDEQGEQDEDGEQELGPAHVRGPVRDNRVRERCEWHVGPPGRDGDRCRSARLHG